MAIGFGGTAPECAFCSTAMPEQSAVNLAPPALAPQSYRVCQACAERFQSGPRMRTFVPGSRADRTWRWPGALASDAIELLPLSIRALPLPTPELQALLAETLAGARVSTLTAWQAELAKARTPVTLAGALAAGAQLGLAVAPLAELQRGVDRAQGSAELGLLLAVYAQRLASMPLELTPRPPSATERQALDVALHNYMLHGPTQPGPLFHRVMALQVSARLCRDGREAEPGCLQQLRRIGDSQLLHDPRLFLLRALLNLRSGHVAAVDRELVACTAWFSRCPAPGVWAEVEAALHYNRYVRALDGKRYDVARDAMKRYLRLQPNDFAAHLSLGHLYLQAAQDPVASLVFEHALNSEIRAGMEDCHNQAPRHEDAILLLCTCLLRTGEADRALRILRADLEDSREHEPLRAERLRLAAHCACQCEHAELALPWLAESFALAPERDTAHDLVVAWMAEWKDRCGSDATSSAGLAMEQLQDLVQLIRQHSGAILAHFGRPHLQMLAWFLGQQLARGGKQEVSFGFAEPLLTGHAVHYHAATWQAYGHLARHDLANAVRKDQQAIVQGAAPIPFALLLQFLESTLRAPTETQMAVMTLLREALA